MPTSTDRIPVPWPQRWEIVREQVLPLAVFAATLAACAVLWRYQAAVTPFAIGEVHVESVVIRSPTSGVLLAADENGTDVLDLFADVAAGAVLARVQNVNGGDSIVELETPLSGRITAIASRPGEFVAKGAPVFTVTSSRPDYIVCYVPDRGAPPPAAGVAVAIRRHGPGAHWTPTTVQAIGPAVEVTPAYHGAAGDRGLPVRLALPTDVELPPGALVEVRFAPAS